LRSLSSPSANAGVPVVIIIGGGGGGGGGPASVNDEDVGVVG